MAKIRTKKFTHRCSESPYWDWVKRYRQAKESPVANPDVLADQSLWHEDQSMADDLQKNLVHILSPYEVVVFLYLWDEELSVVQAAKKLAVSRQFLYTIRKRIIWKVKAYLGGDNE